MSAYSSSRLRAAPVAEPNAENFQLADLVGDAGGTLQDRVAPFVGVYEARVEQGLALYGREILGPVESHVLVRDPRSGRERSMLMLGSNNYLGLATHPHVRASVEATIAELGVGLGGPPLLTGMTSVHRALEAELAALKGKDAAMLFTSGYQANVGCVDGLLRDGDTLLADTLSHASFYDGVKIASVGKPNLTVRSFRHNDVAHLRRLLERARATPKPRGGQIFVAVEGVYSMDGDLAPLPEIVAACRAYDAYLIVDDAHGTGILGENGGGTAEHFGVGDAVDVTMGTLSKALALTGGFLAARADVIQYLRFYARSYMFSAHMPPMVAAAACAGIDVIRREPERRARLLANARTLRDALVSLGFDVIPGEAAILAVRIPATVDIRRLALRFHEEGILLNAIEPPAVPPKEQRLRLSVMATHTGEDLARVAETFERLRSELHFPIVRLT